MGSLTALIGQMLDIAAFHASGCLGAESAARLTTDATRN